jgi:hypothetical protein
LSRAPSRPEKIGGPRAGLRQLQSSNSDAGEPRPLPRAPSL